MIRHLLTIGIDYRGTTAALRGCIADMNAWYGLFAPICSGGKIRLEEQNATKQRMAENISAIAKQCPRGSDHEFIITCSLHGTQRDTNDRQEIDGKDESLCCYDYQRGGLLWDNEIATMLSNSQGLFITDCCHSHTMLRTVVVDSPELSAPRFIPFDQICEGLLQCDINKLCEGADCNRAKARSVRDASGAIPGVIHLAGCLDNEFSYDTPQGGALTINAIDVYRRELANGASYETWGARIKRRFPTRQWPQNPQLTATVEDLRRVVAGKEVGPQTPQPPASAGPGVDVVVGGYRAKAWEKIA
jgi:hypothetical protein